MGDPAVPGSDVVGKGTRYAAVGGETRPRSRKSWPNDKDQSSPKIQYVEEGLKKVTSPAERRRGESKSKREAEVGGKRASTGAGGRVGGGQNQNLAAGGCASIWCGRRAVRSGGLVGKCYKRCKQKGK